MRMLTLLLALSAAATAHSTPCELNLLVDSVRSNRQGVDVRTYQFRESPKSHPRLEVTSETLTLGDLRTIGLRRPSHAARALDWPEMKLETPLRLVRLRFESTTADLAGHRDAFSLHESVRTKFAPELALRQRLLEAALEDLGPGAAVIHVTFGYDMVLWRDLEEVAALGPTRFATRTFFAETLRALGAKGGVMIGGTMPEEATAFDRGPTRYPFEYVRRSGRGPEVLFFRPAKP